MEPLLGNGETFVLRPARSYARGDVVVFRSPADELQVLKRIVAIGGDEVAAVDGALYLNGAAVPVRAIGPARNAQDMGAQCLEERLPSGARYAIVRVIPEPMPSSFRPVRVPPDHVFVLGDHRDRSNDSRNPRIGPIPLSRILGVASAPFGLRSPRLTCGP
jgi:signal peptidase I